MSQPTRVMLELCADSRLAPPPLTGGMYLHVNGVGKAEADPHYAEVNSRPVMPQVVPLSHGPGGLDQSLVVRFLDRTPPVALDRMVHVPLRSVTGKLDAFAVGALADELRLPVQIRTVDLLAGGQELPSGQDRLVPLDHQGRVTTLGQSSLVRVVPTVSRSAGVYADVPAAISQIWAGRPYLSGRIVFGPKGVEIGLPPGLVDHSYGPLLAGFGRPLDGADVEAVRAGGGETVVVGGYAELLRRMESPATSQALVEVDDRVLLADHGPQGVSFMDPETGRGVVFPSDRGPVRFTPYVDTMSLADRLNELRFGPRSAAPAPIVLPSKAKDYRKVTVLGDGVPTSFLDSLVPLAAKIGQPIVVLGRLQTGARSGNEQLIKQLGSLFEQHLWAGRVPVVINRGTSATAELLGLLDSYKASLVHQVPGRTAGMPAAGGLVSFLGNPWTVRAGDPAAGERQPPVHDELGLDLLLFAAGNRRQVAYAPPPRSVEAFVTTPLTDHFGAGSRLDPSVRTLGPLVRQVAARAPFYAAHSAALDLIDAGEGDAVMSYLNQKTDRGQALFKRLHAVPGQTGPERQQGVMRLLPLFATLAGGEVADLASHATFGALNDLLTGAAAPDTVRHRIGQYKDYLPNEAKAPLLLGLRGLKATLPADQEVHLDTVITAIMEC